MFTDEQWHRLHKLILKSGRVYNKSEHWMILEGILYRMRTGCLWRDLPKNFGLWNTVFRRFHLWSKKGILQQLFKILYESTDSK